MKETKMTVPDLRKELKGYIDVMPERTLYALKPLLAMLAEKPLSLEEIAMCEKQSKDFSEET